MAVVQIDGVDSKSLEGFSASLLGPGCRGINGRDAVNGSASSELSCEEDLVAFTGTFEPFPEKIFGISIYIS